MADAHTPTGNNAQITNKILMKLASTRHPPEQQSMADDLLRAMILVRLTGEFGYLTASQVEWRSEFDEHDDLDDEPDRGQSEHRARDSGDHDVPLAARQGAGLIKTQEFISDAVTRIFDDDVIQARVQELLPDLDADSYIALQFFVWIVLTNIEYLGSYEGITAPTFDEIDADSYVRNYLRWYHTWLEQESGR